MMYRSPALLAYWLCISTSKVQINAWAYFRSYLCPPHTSTLLSINEQQVKSLLFPKLKCDCIFLWRTLFLFYVTKRELISRLNFTLSYIAAVWALKSCNHFHATFMFFSVFETLDPTDYYFIDSLTNLPCSAEERQSYESGPVTENLMWSDKTWKAFIALPLSLKVNRCISLMMKFRAFQSLFSEESVLFSLFRQENGEHYSWNSSYRGHFGEKH